MSLFKVINNEQALVLTTPKRNELLRDGPPRDSQCQILGRGTYGIVLKAIYKDHHVAVKIVKNQTKSEMSQGSVDSTLHNESHVLHWKHKNIVCLLKVESTPDFGLIIMERTIGLCLQRVLDTLSLPLLHRIFITLDVLAALRYCHSQYLLHLDVKPLNILVSLGTKSRNLHANRSYMCKLGDFGSSLRLNEFCKSQLRAKGTLRYMSPEALRSGPLSCASDIFSLGITMWQMQTRQWPYHPLTCNESIAYHVVKNDLRPDNYVKIKALQYGSDYFSVARHNCNCVNSRAKLCIYVNKVEDDIQLTNDMYKKTEISARRNLNFETKRSHSRKHSRLSHYFNNPSPGNSTTGLEKAYSTLYKNCWLSSPEIRINSALLQIRLEQILSKCIPSNIS